MGNEDGEFDPGLVPFADRLTVESMYQHEINKDAPLCQPTTSSGGYAVCPVSEQCTMGVPGTGATGAGGAAPSNWFTGLGARSWDFCVPPSPDEDTTNTMDNEEVDMAASNGVDGMPTVNSASEGTVEGVSTTEEGTVSGGTTNDAVVKASTEEGVMKADTSTLLPILLLRHLAF